MTDESAGAPTAEQRVELVEDLFHGTGTTYDEIVRMATWGRDKIWKEELLSHIHNPKRILDLACGTGILLLDMKERFGCHITGVELREEYLQHCRARAKELGHEDIRLILSRAEEVLLDEQFDHITSCYIPKYADLDAMIPNMVKMLAPGGLFIMQDFAFPKEKWVQNIFYDHFERMKQRCSEMPDWDALWERLPAVLEKTTWIEDTERLMKEQGLVDVTVVGQTRWMSALVYGRQPKA